MDPSPPIASAPPLLAPGFILGSWRVLALAGQGVHGEVYRAVRAQEPDSAPPVALKLARRPYDSRFSREVKLLSLCLHPSVPPVLDQGTWRPEDGRPPHPFFVMQWVDGEPLYQWAQRQQPSSQQVLQVLGQLAHALALLHSQGGVHRDVKGDNILVRREDGRAMLIDFGSGVPPGASTLTPPGAFVGTPAYRSAESALFELTSLRQPDARYRASPADDVFALGATACRLLTGQYPEPGEPIQDAKGQWRLESLVLPPALHTVEEPLRSHVLSMLALHSEQSPGAAQLAHALGQGPQPPRLSAPRRAWRPAHVLAGLALTAGSLLVAAGAWWAVSWKPSQSTAATGTESAHSEGTTALGEATSSVSRKESAVSSPRQTAAQEPLPEPQPGQMRPDAKGHCPDAQMVLLNGVCWARTQLARQLCESTHGQMFKGQCYQPITPPEHPPTSSPKNSQDAEH